MARLDVEDKQCNYVSALADIGYDGFACIEVEDGAVEDSRQKILDSRRVTGENRERIRRLREQRKRT